MVLGVLILSATLVGAAVLTYFGQVNTTMNAKQSIVISADGTNWNNYNQPINRDLGDVVHCTDYCYKLWIKNQACVDAEVSFEDTPEEEGIDIQHWVFGDTQTIMLTHKDQQWNPIGDPIKLTFETCGTTFNWELSSLPEGYSLVYYIDQEDRFNNWGKVFVIGNTITGSVDIPSMPYAEDLNYASGAKFWLVPTCNLDDPSGLTYLDPWLHESYYYEQSLGLYIDCNGPVTCMPCYHLFDTTVLKAGQTYCWISCYHVAFNIAPGVYSFQTTVDAAPVID